MHGHERDGAEPLIDYDINGYMWDSCTLPGIIG